MCTASLSLIYYRVLVCAVGVCLWDEDRQVSIQNNVGQGVDQRLIVDDQEHLENTQYFILKCG